MQICKYNIEYVQKVKVLNYSYVVNQIVITVLLTATFMFMHISMLDLMQCNESLTVVQK